MDESEDKESGGDDDASGVLLDDDVASPPPFLRPTQCAQRIERAKETTALANSLLLPGESFAPVESGKKQDGPQRSSSLPSCSMPTPNRYVSPADAPGYGWGAGLSAKHQHMQLSSRNNTDVEDAYLLALFENGQSRAPLKVSLPAAKIVDEVIEEGLNTVPD